MTPQTHTWLERPIKGTSTRMKVHIHISIQEMITVHQRPLDRNRVGGSGRKLINSPTRQRADPARDSERAALGALLPWAVRWHIGRPRAAPWRASRVGRPNDWTRGLRARLGRAGGECCFIFRQLLLFG